MLVFKSYAKLNIFLKIVGKRGDYHRIKSRFVRYDNLHDELVFNVKGSTRDGFRLTGNFDCTLEENIIYKAYKLLREVHAKKVDEFFRHYTLHVKKNIPSGGGLGGGSSNAATFLLAMNELSCLNLGIGELCDIGSKVGSDVNFFLHGCKSANVKGVGDIVNPIDDDIPDIEPIFTHQKCDTSNVYKSFSNNFFSTTDRHLIQRLEKTNSRELLNLYQPMELNDLLRSVLLCYPTLDMFASKGFFLSGSGSTFFRVSK